MSNSNFYKNEIQVSNNLRQAVLLEINEIPDGQIFQLLQVIRAFRNSQVAEQKAKDNWEKAINELENSTVPKRKNQKKNIQQLFQSWNDLDDLEEQQKTWQIIESMKGVSI